MAERRYFEAIHAYAVRDDALLLIDDGRFWAAAILKGGAGTK
jgi:hypothetical protein